MNLQPIRRSLTVVVMALSVAVVITSGAPAQSLGDLARQEEARRKGTSTAGKVYTNDDLRGAPAPAASSPARPAPSAASPAAGVDGKSPATSDAKAGAKGTTPDPRKDETTWRNRRKSIQEALDRARTLADALQSRINGLTADFSARDDPAQRNVVAAERQKALTEFERVKKEIEQHTQGLADLQEDARKSGVPPGWLR